MNLDELRAFTAFKLPDSLSYSDLLDHFGASAAATLELLVEEMDSFLNETNLELKDFFSKVDVPGHANEFEIGFNTLIANQVASWKRSDHSLRRFFRSRWTGYQPSLKAHDMTSKLNEQLYQFSPDIIALVNKANSYSCEWINSAAKFGLRITDSKAIETITWLSTLTEDGFKANYFQCRLE